MSHPLIVVAWLSLTLAVLSALTVVADLVLDGAQTMWIMNIVWPVTALWAGPLGLLGYPRFGRAGSRRAARAAEREHCAPPGRRQPFPILVAKGTSHCGSGCTVGDLVAEALAFAFPLTFFGHRLFGVWIYDYALAYLFGIAFQYYTIKPMQNLSPLDGLWKAIKVDTLSLTAWKIGMFGWMAVVRFAIFRRSLSANDPAFWLMMQVAMFCGFATSYPANWWLLRRGIKEAM